MQHDDLAPVRAALSRPPVVVDEPDLQHASVAAIFTPGRRLWLIRRADRLGDPWSGHLAFPGGRASAQDRNSLATAVRETWEETGADLQGAELLGQLDDVRSRPMTRMIVRAFVFSLPEVPLWRPNYEVADLLSVSLDDLLSGVGRGQMRFPPVVGLRLPSVDVSGQRLWGLTLHMVDDLLHRIDGRGVGLQRTP